DAENTAGQLYEECGLAESHAGIKAVDVEQIGRCFFEELDRFRIGAPAKDDTTYLVIGFDGLWNVDCKMRIGVEERFAFSIRILQSAFRIQIMIMPRILIADDQPDVLEALRLLLKSEEYEIQAVNSPAEVLRALEARDYNVLLMDLSYA